MVNILHISDLHLDRPFATGDSHIAFTLRQASKRSLTLAVDYCIRENVDFLIISGDLFDSDTVSPETAYFIWNEIKRLEDHRIRVLYATGNHDSSAAIRGLKYFKWPENVTIFESEQWEAVHMTTPRGEKICFVGAGYTSRKFTENRIAEFPLKGDIEEKPDYVVGIAHSEILSGPGAQSASMYYSYMPCTKEDIKKLGYDYFALGHIHARQIFYDINAAYSGSLQALRINETGLRGGVKVTLKPDEAKLENVNFSTVMFETLWVDVTGVHLIEDIMEACVVQIEKLMAENEYNGDALILQCHIKGKTSAWSEVKSEEVKKVIEEEIKIKTGVLKTVVFADEVTGYVFADEYAHGDNILGYIISLIDSEESREDISKEVYDSLKERLGSGFSGKDAEYVSQILSNNRDYIAGLFIRGPEKNEN